MATSGGPRIIPGSEADLALQTAKLIAARQLNDAAEICDERGWSIEDHAVVVAIAQLIGTAYATLQKKV